MLRQALSGSRPNEIMGTRWLPWVRHCIIRGSASSLPRSAMSLAQVQLQDKYTLPSGRVFISGMQALVRLALLQAGRDQAAGLNTAGFITGYRGSPVGGLDLELWQALPLLDAAGIKFQPGVNEDLAATA